MQQQDHRHLVEKIRVLPLVKLPAEGFGMVLKIGAAEGSEAGVVHLQIIECGREVRRIGVSSYVDVALAGTVVA